jgi:hypothetical protein
MTRDSSPSLPPRADALLGDWPSTRSEDAWESAARKIDERVSTARLSPAQSLAEKPADLDALLEAPFPKAVDEGAAPGDPAMRSGLRSLPPSAKGSIPPPSATGNGSVSLAELARAQVKKRKDVEAREVAKELLVGVKRERMSDSDLSRPSRPPAAATPLPTSSARNGGGIAPPAPSSAALAANGARAPESAHVAEAAPASTDVQSSRRAPESAKRKSGGMGWVGMGFGALGIAAAVFMYLGRPGTNAEAPAAQTVAAADEPKTANGAEAPASPDQPTLGARSDALGGDPLKVAMNDAPGTSRAARVKGLASKMSGDKAAPAASAGSPTPDSIVLDDEAQAQAAAANSEPTAAATAETKQAEAKPAEQKMQPADDAHGVVPDKPSMAAVSAATRGVVGNAKSCVAGYTEPSTATIVFASGGSVQSVSVSGAAAGTPAEACIKGALSKARIEPFARASFAVPVTVRP